MEARLSDADPASDHRKSTSAKGSGFFESGVHLATIANAVSISGHSASSQRRLREMVTIHVAKNPLRSSRAQSPKAAAFGLPSNAGDVTLDEIIDRLYAVPAATSVNAALRRGCH